MNLLRLFIGFLNIDQIITGELKQRIKIIDKLSITKHSITIKNIINLNNMLVMTNNLL